MTVYQVQWFFNELDMDDEPRQDGIYRTKQLAEAAAELIKIKYYDRIVCSYVRKVKVRTKLRKKL